MLLFVSDQAIAYFVSKSIVEIPIALVQVCLQYVIVYNLCNFQGFWVYLILAAWGLGVASASVAILLGCAVADVKHVTELSPLLFVPQILFAGFFVKMSQIPVFLRWAQYLCALKYAMNIILLVEFDSSNESCHFSADAAANCQKVLVSNNIHPKLWWVYVIMLGVLFFGFRSTGAYVLVQKAKRFY